MAGRVHLLRGLVLYQDRPCGAVDAIDCTGRAHFQVALSHSISERERGQP